MTTDHQENTFVIDDEENGASLPPPGPPVDDDDDEQPTIPPSSSSSSLSITNKNKVIITPHHHRPDLDDDSNGVVVQAQSETAGASLPSPDEVKGMMAASNGSGGGGGEAKRRGCCFWWSLLAILILVLAIVLGIVFGIKTQQRPSTTTTSTTASNNNDEGQDWIRPETNPPLPTTNNNAGGPRKATLNDVVKYLHDNGISSPESLQLAAAPQHLAATWIASQDDLNLPVPDVSHTAPAGYHYVTRYILAVLYYSTQGNNWTNSFNWLSARDHCLWNTPGVLENGQPGGVYCEAQQNQYDSLFEDNDTGSPITNLFLDANNLNGTIPREIKFLNSLLTINMGSNFLKTSVGLQEFCELIRLRTLGLEHNRLVSQLPGCLADMTELREVFLSNNGLVGNVPSLQRLSDLIVLKLDDNEGLTGDVASFDTLPNIEYLFLSGNPKWQGFIDESFLSSLTKLRGLDISNCLLPGRFPSHLLQNNPNLELLDVHGNELTGNDWELTSIQEHAQLKYLALHRNQLTGAAVPANIINLKALKHLDVSSNKFSGGMMLPQLPVTLEYLFLADNDFDAGTIPSEFASLINLQELSLKSTQRNGNIPGFLGSLMPNLVLLDLDDNQLTGEIPYEIGSLSQLQFLLLNRNPQLSGTIPPEWIGLGKLRVGLFDNTAISGSFDTTLCLLPNFDAHADNDFDAPQGLQALSADCGGTGTGTGAVTCDCCKYCCKGGDAPDGGMDDDPVTCHDQLQVANLDPAWENDYERFEFSFGNGTVTYTDMRHINKQRNSGGA